MRNPKGWSDYSTYAKKSLVVVYKVKLIWLDVLEILTKGVNMWPLDGSIILFSSRAQIQSYVALNFSGHPGKL